MSTPMEVVETERPQPPRNKTNDPRGPISIPTNVRQRPAPLQAGGVRTNLITVPIQDSAPIVHETPAPPQTYYNQYQQPHNYNQALPPMHIPPPQGQYYAAPPAYSPAQTYAPYSNPAPPPTPAPQYAPPPAVAQPRPPQYDYGQAPPQQWPNNQPYYR